MAETLKVDIDIKQLLDLGRNLPPSAMQNAWRRTLRKTSNWIKSQTAKAVSKETKIPQKLLRQRLYFFLRSRDTGKVWLGLNALEADRLGKARQTRAGVTVGRHRFQSAWIYRSRYGDGGKQRSIKIKRSSGAVETKSYNSSDANTGKVFQRVGKERTPYQRVKFDWSASGEAAFKEAAARAEERLMVVLRQEVNYEIHKAVGRAR